MRCVVPDCLLVRDRATVPRVCAGHPFEPDCPGKCPRQHPDYGPEKDKTENKLNG